ncbi:hypothetical protein [Sphingomonas tagetis]
MQKEVLELGIASQETKGDPVIGEPDTFELQKLVSGLSAD